MFLILNFLISFGSSTINYQDSTLYISDEPTIDSALVNEHTNAKACVITSDGEVSIKANTFFSFVSLKNLTIQVSTINFESNSLQQMSLTELNVDAKNTINISESSFASTRIDNATLHAGKQIILGYQSFKASDSIALITISSEGTITIGEQAFATSRVNSINIISTKDLVIGSESFHNCQYITTLRIESKEGGITFDQTTFSESEIQEIIIKTHNNVVLGEQSMQLGENFNSIVIETDGNFATTKHSFSHSTINKLSIRCNGYATFAKQTFLQTPSLTNFTVLSNNDITFEEMSFLQSKVNSMTFITNGSINFGKQCFQKTTNLNTFEVNSTGELYFGEHAFLGSSITTILLNTTDQIVFSKQSFQNCLSLTNFIIETMASVTFGQQCFHNSEVKEVVIINPDQSSSNLMKLSSKSSTITFEKQSFAKCEQLKNVNINTQGNVDIQSNSFKNSKSLANVVVDAKNGEVTVADFAFSGCKSIDELNIDAKTSHVSDKAYQEGGDDEDGDGDGGKKKGGSSHKDNDDDSQKNAKLLGNIEIESVYLGTSPNIYFNMNFLLGFMRNVRKIVGHAAPSPEFIHSAIWVGKKNANDDTLGAIFVYGKYWNKLNLPSYIDRDGAKACVMSLKEFKQRYPSIDPMKLNPNRKLKLFDFIEEVKNSGNWRASDYNWPTNNCQHFTSKLINILKATRNNPSENDWIDLPKPVLNSLKSNEKQNN